MIAAKETFSRLQGTGTSIFSTMSALALSHGAVNLGQGFPDFMPPAQLIERTKYWAEQGKNQYAPSHGVPTLRTAISDKLTRHYQVRYDAETEVTVTSGATEALFCAIMCATDPGDEVLLFEPAYDSYAPAVLMAGATPRFIRLEAPFFRIDWDTVRRSMTPKVKLVVVNNPHNPCGTVMGTEDIEQLHRLAEQWGFYVLSDEVYEHITFNKPHLSIATHEGLQRRTFVVASFGKTYHNTGWKIGYCVAPFELTAAFRRVHQFVTFSSFTPAQYALAEILYDDTWFVEVAELYSRRRALALKLLQETPFEVYPTEGSYFQLIALQKISEIGDRAFAEQLVKQTGVATIPLSPFYHDGFNPGYLRICFAKQESTLIEGISKLCKI
jgi:methionine aminotransferase